MSSPSYAHLARSFFPELVVQHLFLPVSGGTVTFALLGDHVCLQPLGLFFAVEPEHRLNPRGADPELLVRRKRSGLESVPGDLEHAPADTAG
jgi:hypothetical protein